LLPVRVPDLANTTRGSSSNDFKPLPQKKKDGSSIPVDLQRFRLYTGAPIFVDFKAIPYQDREVLDWRARLRLAEEVQEMLGEGLLSGAREKLRTLHVSHLVLPSGQAIRGHGFHLVYEDPFYRVFRLTTGSDRN